MAPHRPCLSFVIMVPASVRIVSVVNDSKASSHCLKQEREVIGTCQQKWCLASGAAVPTTWTLCLLVQLSSEMGSPSSKPLSAW